MTISLEMTAWSLEELSSEIIRRTPKGLAFVRDRSDGWFTASFIDADANVVWQGYHADLRFLLFDVLGWLILRGTKPRNPVWTPRTHEVDISQRLHRAASPTPVVPDPLDLDPEELISVYTQRDK